MGKIVIDSKQLLELVNDIRKYRGYDRDKSIDNVIAFINGNQPLESIVKPLLKMAYDDCHDIIWDNYEEDKEQYIKSLLEKLK